METGPRFKVSSKGPEKWGINLAIPGLVIWHVIHYTTPTPNNFCDAMLVLPENEALNKWFCLFQNFVQVILMLASIKKELKI